MRALVVLPILLALWVPYCIVAVLAPGAWEWKFTELINGLIDWVQ